MASARQNWVRFVLFKVECRQWIGHASRHRMPGQLCSSIATTIPSDHIGAAAPISTPSIKRANCWFAILKCTALICCCGQRTGNARWTPSTSAGVSLLPTTLSAVFAASPPKSEPAIERRVAAIVRRGLNLSSAITRTAIGEFRAILCTLSGCFCPGNRLGRYRPFCPDKELRWRLAGFCGKPGASGAKIGASATRMIIFALWSY